MIESYSDNFIYLALIIGVGLSLIRPYFGFLFGVLGLSALDFVRASQTRTFFLGPYFNLLDSLIMVLFVSYFFDTFRSDKNIRIIPKAVVLISIVWVIGTFEAGFSLDWRYEVIREAKWAINLPLIYFVSANMVIDKQRCYYLLITLFLAGVVASLSHLFYLFGSHPALTYLNLTNQVVRVIGYLFSPAVYFLVAATHTNIFIEHKSPIFRVFWFIALLLFAASVILAQTRSQWIAIAFAPLVLGLILHSSNVVKRTAILSVIISFFIIFVAPQILPENIKTQELFFGRMNSLTDEELRLSTTQTRMAALEVETRSWLNGNWLTGNGFAYHYVLPYGGDASVVAWGHLGYISYLARLGIIGFIVYAIYLPLSGIRSARKLYFYEPDSATSSLALLGLACFIIDGITFITSGSYLNLGPSVSAVLFGAVTMMANMTEPAEMNEQLTRGSYDWDDIREQVKAPQEQLAQ